MSRLTLADLPARYQAQVTGQAKPAPKLADAVMLRQNTAPALNKTETAWLDVLRADLPPEWRVLIQSITLRLANGCRYTPDFALLHGPTGAVRFYEVKGYMRDDAAVKIKVAAAQFPAWAFWLVWRKAGAWQQQRILA